MCPHATIYGAAEAAARLQDMDAIIATQSALEEWQQVNAKMHVSPLAPAYHEFPPKSDSEAASTPDMQDRYVQRGGGERESMQDTPIQAPIQRGTPQGLPHPQHRGAGARGGGGGEQVIIEQRASRLAPPMQHGAGMRNRP